LADVDGDGRTDMVSGDFFGRVHWFARAVEGGFHAPSPVLTVEGEPLDAGDASCVYPCDWDGNGRLDLLIGNMDGDVLLARGAEGDEPRFHALEPVRAFDGPLQAPSGDAAPLLTDWDGDGIADFLLGAQDGSIVWRRNVAKQGPPQLGPEQTLVSALEWSAAPTDRSDKRVKLDVVDWNADGRLDLLVGDVSFQPGTPAAEAEFLAAQVLARTTERALEPFYATLRARAEELYGARAEEALDGERYAAASRRAMAELESNPDYVAAMRAHLEASEDLSRIDTKVHEAGRVWVFLGAAHHSGG
jgi:hypothetical protein